MADTEHVRLSHTNTGPRGGVRLQTTLIRGTANTSLSIPNVIRDELLFNVIFTKKNAKASSTELETGAITGDT